MAKLIAPLTDKQVVNAKEKDKNYKMSDGSGLYLLVTIEGYKLWRLDYYFDDKRKTISFGRYPEITLADARQKRTEARSLI